MCGIFGLVSKSNLDINKSRESLNILEHRGPDQWNEYVKENVYIGHRRLSILDLSDNGKQPMTDENEDVVISVNGEIYNYKELKKELEKNYNFKSNSDSEVILYGFKEWGIDELLERIDGMFAFVIYDRLKDQIFLCRDRVGIKPLYYAKLNETFVWASELKAIQNYFTENSLEKDTTALYDFFTYQYIPTPKTLYKNVFKLPPAHYIKVNVSNLSYDVHKYWELKVGNKQVDTDTAQKEVVSLLKESINEQMVSDVPVGFFLSGGIDSSVVVALASKLNNDVSTFTIGFTEKKHDETKYAAIVADLFKTNHHKKILNEGDAKNLLGNIRKWYDEPFADLSCVPTYLVSDFAKKDVTVVLTGDGGDELFGGYKWYYGFDKITRIPFRQSKIAKYTSKLLAKLFGKFDNRIQRLELLSLDELELYTKLMGGMMKSEKSELREKFMIPEDYDDYWYFRKFYNANLDVMTRLQYLDFNTYLHDDILTKVDRVSMQVALECRVPFLSRKIIEYVFSISHETRNPKGELKGLLKKSLEGTLPDEILYREKKGFSMPTNSWRDGLYGVHKNRLYKILNENFNIKV